MDSPERQRANIEGVLRAKGYIPEWYTDAEGHKSGTKEHNRPGWLSLQQRLKDPDVAAVIANDLARLHRKGWRVGRLIDMLEERGVFLTYPSRKTASPFRLLP
jgi:DNA invertase Pin-like site-specific DNA recombinase